MHWWTEILKEAQKRLASEVYLTAGGNVLLRIEGTLYAAQSKVAALTSFDVEEIVILLLDHQQRNLLDANNYILTRYIHEDIGRCRVVVTRQRNTYSITLRLYYAVERLESFKMCKPVEQLTRINEGLIVVGGLAHSGRSTLCAQLMMNINNEKPAYIVSLEQTLSYLLPHRRALINQREIGLDVTTYSVGLEACIYENADVVVIDDYTDPKAIDEALVLAMQDRLVVLTVRSKNAAQVMQQLLASGDSHQAAYRRHLLQSALRAIIVQQLVIDDRDQLLPIYEVVYNNQAVQSLIETGTIKSINDVILRYTKMGMSDFDTYLAEMVLNNKLSKNRALALIESMSNFEMALMKALP